MIAGGEGYGQYHRVGDAIPARAEFRRYSSLAGIPGLETRERSVQQYRPRRVALLREAIQAAAPRAVVFLGTSERGSGLRCGDPTRRWARRRGVGAKGARPASSCSRTPRRPGEERVFRECRP